MAATLRRTDLASDPGAPALARRLAGALEGEVRFDAFDRARYSTDASIYQIEPAGVVLPRSDADVQAALAIAREAGVPVIARGGGTSQAGQTVGDGLVIDYSRHLDRVLELDPAAQTVWVEPGVVLDRLNRSLKPHGLFFPVDISTGSRATLGGMAANNACGARSLRYGIMVDNLLAIDALLADGEPVQVAEVPGNLAGVAGSQRYVQLIHAMRALAAREADAIAAGFPAVQRRVGGYNLDRIRTGGHNMASLLVGSEGTLALFRRLKLRLQPLPAHRVLGVCHFPTFYQAMASAAAIVALGPAAVELVDRTIIELGREIPAYRPLIERFVRGTPDALLLVEFAGDERAEQLARLARLGELMADLGLPEAVVEATEPAAQARIWDVRKAGLNIVMSMKSAGKPVSFIEDCAVPLEHLADYTQRLTEIFARHGTSGTWYAHASVGCLHVRPILNLKHAEEVAKMRAIAEEAMALVRAFKGSPFRRARRRPGALGVPRGRVRATAGAGVRGGQGRVRPGGRAQPGQDRARAAHGRAPPAALSAGLPGRGARAGARLAGVGRVPRRRRDVQQQRRLPQGRARRDVPVLPGDAGRDPRHPGPRQQPAAGAQRTARAGGADLGRDGGDARSVRLLQGLPARMPDRGRHGADEDRGPASAAASAMA